MTDYEEVGLTTEKYAEITTDLIEILVKQIDANSCIREVNERHPELTDEQRKLLQLDKQYTTEELDAYLEEAFGPKGLKAYIQNALIRVIEDTNDDKEEN